MQLFAIFRKFSQLRLSQFYNDRNLISSSLHNSGKGCVWCPAFLKDGTIEMDVPWCTYGVQEPTQAPTQQPTTQSTTHSTPNTPEPLVCSDPDRDECGWSGMTPQECLDEGCVWCPYSGHRAHCSHTMSTTTTDSPDPTEGPTVGPTEPGETTTTKKPPSGGDGELCLETQQCPPPPANCNIPDLMDREDCGELASTPTTCIASGQSELISSSPKPS